MATLKTEIEIAVEKRLEKIERAIQKLLIDFVADTGRQIDSVRVDTREYANLSVEVFLKSTTTPPD